MTLAAMMLSYRIELAKVRIEARKTWMMCHLLIGFPCENIYVTVRFAVDTAVGLVHYWTYLIPVVGEIWLILFI